LVITGLFLCLCMQQFFFYAPAYAEKIPALSLIPADVRFDIRVELMKKKAVLEEDFATFEKAAQTFNEKEAKDQSDLEFQQLEDWRNRYIEAVKRFNREVVESRNAKVLPGNKWTPQTVGAASVRGSFSIQNRDGSIFSNANVSAGTAVRLESGARVTTGPTGHVQCLLLDQTVFTIGPNSNMIIDEFVYDTDMSPKKVSVLMSIGFFRWVTGKVARKDPKAMKVTLPVGTLGIRGTDFEAFVAPDGSGYIKLFSGYIEVTPLKDGKTFQMGGKSLVRFGVDGTFSNPEAVDPADNI